MLPRPAALALGLILAACGGSPEADDGIDVRNQAGAAAVPAGPAPAEVRGQDFVSAVLGTYRFEIESAALAAAKSDRADVKQFAGGLATAFQTSLTSLSEIARSGGLDATPTPGPTHQSDLAILSSTRGAPLEKAFMEQQQLALTDLLGLVRAYKNGGDNPRLKAWAETNQTMIADQLDKAQTLKAVVGEGAAF